MRIIGFLIFVALVVAGSNVGFVFNPQRAIAAAAVVRAKTEKTIEGKVVGVHDGDTITVLDAEKVQHKIRLNGIDAPELKQDFGNRSKQNLSDLVFGKTVRVKVDKKDRYGREVGVVFVDGKDANLEQVKAGFAWHYKKYAAEQTDGDRKKYAEAEAAARSAKRGLWVDGEPVAPWDYRRPSETTKATANVGKTASSKSTARNYIRGPRGGCFYINSKGNKTYVDRSLCR